MPKYLFLGKKFKMCSSESNVAALHNYLNPIFLVRLLPELFNHISLGSVHQKLWNLVMDALLRELTGMENTHPIAYADDLAILISGKSRAELERLQ